MPTVSSVVAHLLSLSAYILPAVYVWHSCQTVTTSPSILFIAQSRDVIFNTWHTSPLLLLFRNMQPRVILTNHISEDNIICLSRLVDAYVLLAYTATRTVITYSFIRVSLLVSCVFFHICFSIFPAFCLRHYHGSDDLMWFILLCDNPGSYMTLISKRHFFKRQ